MSMTLTPEQMLGLLPDVEERHQQVILDGLQLGAERGRIALMGATPVDQGEARRGWVVRRNAKDVELRNDTVHAAVLEKGRRPGQRPPPLEAILEWVQRHADELGIGLERSSVETRDQLIPSGHTTKEGQEMDAWEADAYFTALMIRAKIAKRGQKPLAIMGSRIDLLKRWAAEEVMREYATI